MNEPAPLRFYFDFISHNAYLAWVRTREIASAHQRALHPFPVLFAGLLKAGGQLGPAEIPAKARWMVRDVARKALDLGIPLAPPASHPFNPLVPLRVASLAPGEIGGDDAAREALIDALFRATWADSRDVSDPAVAAEVASEVGLDGAALVERAQQPEIKARLREATDRAISLGVFGVPTVIVGDPVENVGPFERELFWGFDDLPNLERLLAGRDPLSSHDFSPWTKVRPSAQRPR